jgi:S1-C subfamily serine protease
MNCGTKIYASVCALAIALTALSGARGDELQSQGKAVMEKCQQAVVTLQIVVSQKTSMSGMDSEENEMKLEATGFFINPEGLCVVALSGTDPQSVLASMMPEDYDIKIESQVRDLKILIQDGTELPGSVVLRDKDLDLAFVRPNAKPAAPVPFIDLAQAVKAEVLEPVIALNRLGKVAGRVSSASVERIEAVIQKPRVWYVPGSSPSLTGTGSPVFSLGGQIIGMVTLRQIKAEQTDALHGLFGGGQMPNMIGVIVPAADILEGSKQVPAEGQETPTEP